MLVDVAELCSEPSLFIFGKSCIFRGPRTTRKRNLKLCSASSYYGRPHGEIKGGGVSRDKRSRDPSRALTTIIKRLLIEDP